MRPETALRLLTWLLYILGGMMTAAYVAVVMPTTWMAEIATWLGVGPLPRTPLTEYLTRSLSAIYGGSGFSISTWLATPAATSISSSSSAG